ncbi:MAG: LapA family protein [Thermodesulfobacteriota bacterium]|nr:LapA family protein [Thermodesulfobacteriota bacterium]
MSLFKGVFYLLLLAAAIGFAIHNDQPVSLKYYFGWVSIPLPLFLWAFLAFFIGLIISGVWAALSKVGLRSRIRMQKKAIAELERKRIAAKRMSGL